jgi:hypothetical protein
MSKLFLVVLLCFGFGVVIFFNLSSSGDRQIEAQHRDDQDRILVNLAAMNDPVVSEFVKDWLHAFPEPNAEKLSELRVIEQNIKNDKAAAAKYTLAWHREHDLACKVSGMGESCVPGL